MKGGFKPWFKTFGESWSSPEVSPCINCSLSPLYGLKPLPVQPVVCPSITFGLTPYPDFNLRRRNFGEYQENYSSGDQLGMGDSCGVHASGAGFENQDRLSGDFWDQFRDIQ